MNRLFVKILCTAVAVVLATPYLFGQEAPITKEPVKVKSLDIQIKDIGALDVFEPLDNPTFLQEPLEESLAALEVSLEHLQHIDFTSHLQCLNESIAALDCGLQSIKLSLPEIPTIELSDLPPLPPIEAIHIHAVDIPPLPPLPHLEAIHIPPIPPIHVPEIDFSCTCGWTDDENADLTEEEQVRLEALRSLARNQHPGALDFLEKALQEEQNPSVRCRVLTILRNVEDDRVVPILAEVAKSDVSTRVRKQAIRYLGQSKDDRAAATLKELIE